MCVCICVMGVHLSVCVFECPSDCVSIPDHCVHSFPPLSFSPSKFNSTQSFPIAGPQNAAQDHSTGPNWNWQFSPGY